MPASHYPISMPSITAVEENYVMEAVRSGWVSSLGPYVAMFEERFAKFCGVEEAVGVANGTVALHLALVAMGIGPGDEVIVPDLSFVATANTVIMAGAKPVFCDIEPEYLCMDPVDFERKITSRTKAVMPVHLYGHPADMEAINAIARRHNIKVIEDAAEAHGAAVNGVRVGGLGDCATFSFYGNKNLTSGEGGMITSHDKAFLERCRHLRDHAMSPTKRYWHDQLGYNYRIASLQAALGAAQLERADELLATRVRIFNDYRDAMAGMNNVRLNRTAPGATHSYWMICAEFDDLDEFGRDDLMTRLKSRGVDTRPYFYSMSDMPYFETADTPVSHKVSRIGINLPIYVGLTTADIQAIVQHLREIRA